MSLNPFSALYRWAYNAVASGVADAIKGLAPAGAEDVPLLTMEDLRLTMEDLRQRLAIAPPAADVPEIDLPETTKAVGRKGRAS